MNLFCRITDDEKAGVSPVEVNSSARGSVDACLLTGLNGDRRRVTLTAAHAMIFSCPPREQTVFTAVGI